MVYVRFINMDKPYRSTQERAADVSTPRTYAQVVSGSPPCPVPKPRLSLLRPAPVAAPRRARVSAAVSSPVAAPRRLAAVSVAPLRVAVPHRRVPVIDASRAPLGVPVPYRKGPAVAPLVQAPAAAPVVQALAFAPVVRAPVVAPAAPRRKRPAQQALPPRHQAAVPTINGRVNQPAASNNNMQLVIRHGIPRRTCFAMEFTSKRRYLSVTQFISDNKLFMGRALEQRAPRRFKLHMAVEAEFHQATDEDQRKNWHLSTRAQPVEDVDEYFSSSASALDEKIAEYSALGSEWKIARIIKLSLVVSEYSELCRLSGQCHFQTPAMIRNKHCVINVNNDDTKCFVYAVLAALKHHLIDNGQRHRSQKYDCYLDELKWDVDDMPMRLVNIPKFERMNPAVAVNIIKFTPPSLNNYVPADEEGEVFKHPCLDLVYRSKQSITAETKVVHLLLCENGEGQFHYMAVTSLDRLLNCRRSGLVGRRIHNKICHSCLRMFRLQSTLDKHKPLCETLKVFGTIYTMPEKSHLEFDQWQKTIPPKFIVYADFESLLEKPDDEGNLLQVHMPIAAASLVLKPDGSRPYNDFYGEDCIVSFLRHLEILAKDVHQWYVANAHVPMRRLCEIEVDQHDETLCC